MEHRWAVIWENGEVELAPRYLGRAYMRTYKKLHGKRITALLRLRLVEVAS